MKNQAGSLGLNWYWIPILQLRIFGKRGSKWRIDVKIQRGYSTQMIFLLDKKWLPHITHSRKLNPEKLNVSSTSTLNNTSCIKPPLPEIHRNSIPSKRAYRVGMNVPWEPREPNLERSSMDLKIITLLYMGAGLSPTPLVTCWRTCIDTNLHDIKEITFIFYILFWV